MPPVSVPSDLHSTGSPCQETLENRRRRIGTTTSPDAGREGPAASGGHAKAAHRGLRRVKTWGMVTVFLKR